MPAELEQTLREGSGILVTLLYAQLAILGAKTLPLLLVVCFPAPGNRRAALVWGSVLLGIVVLVAKRHPAVLAPAVVTLGVLAYYLSATLCSFRLNRWLRSGVLRKDTLFVVLGLVFVIAPASVLRRLGQIELLVLGWSITLSIFSYSVEASRNTRALSLREFLFFVLIDPTVSFPDRSRQVRSPAHLVVRRLALGLCLMVLSDRLLRLWTHWNAWLERERIEIDLILTFALAATTAFFAAYWVRAGAAQIRIGMMQSLGYQPPECFNRPYLATSPLDFWRRWNCWVGSWVRRYLFAPLTLSLMRQRGAYGMTGAPAHALGLVGSFAAMGLLHDWLIFANMGTSTFVYVRVFLFAACGLLAWEAIASWSRGENDRPLREPNIWHRWMARLGPAAYVSAMLVIAGRI